MGSVQLSTRESPPALAFLQPLDGPHLSFLSSHFVKWNQTSKLSSGWKLYLLAATRHSSIS